VGSEWLEAIRTRDARYRERMKNEYVAAGGHETTS